MEYNILEQNKELIERFINLVTCNDYIIDSRHKWFYSTFRENELIQLNIEPEDIRQDIYIFIIEQYRGYEGRNFNLYLNLSLSRFVRDKLLSLIREQETINQMDYPITCTLDILGSFDLSWIFKQPNLPLTDYERYLLYLDLYQCYTINQICDVTYQDRKTIRRDLKIARHILIQELT